MSEPNSSCCSGDFIEGHTFQFSVKDFSDIDFYIFSGNKLIKTLHASPFGLIYFPLDKKFFDYYIGTLKQYDGNIKIDFLSKLGESIEGRRILKNIKASDNTIHIKNFSDNLIDSSD